MKVKQIIGEHKKGVRAHIYARKAKVQAQGTVPLYGPDKQEAKLTPYKAPKAKVNEDGDVVKQYEPGKSVTVDNPTSGVSTTVDLTKAPGALHPNDKGELELDPTPDAGTTGATQQPEIKPGAPVTVKDETVAEEGDDIQPPRQHRSAPTDAAELEAMLRIAGLK